MQLWNRITLRSTYNKDAAQAKKRLEGKELQLKKSSMTGYSSKRNAFEETGKPEGHLVIPGLDTQDPKETGKKRIIDRNHRSSEPETVGEMHGFKPEGTTIINIEGYAQRENHFSVVFKYVHNSGKMRRTPETVARFVHNALEEIPQTAEELEKRVGVILNCVLN